MRGNKWSYIQIQQERNDVSSVYDGYNYNEFI